MKINILLITALVACGLKSGAQTTAGLSLPECYRLAEQNYPLVQRAGLIRQTANYTIENLQKGYLPQVTVNAQATYQSTVTQVPISLPGVNIPQISKDQYKATAEVNQLLYDGGEIAGQKSLQRSNEAVSQQRLAADLYELKGRVNQLFFGVLLANEQLKQNDLLLANLNLGLKKAEASVKNGTAFRSNADLISAEILSAKQRSIELEAARKAYTDMLSQFIGKSVDENTALAMPEPIEASTEIKRPELAAFDEQAKGLDVQDKLLSAGTRPKLAFFVQGGYGRPGLNMLSNNFAGYYIGGFRLNWSPSAFYTLKNKRAQLGINKKEIEVQKETFLFNTNLSVKQQSREISKYQRLSATDDEIIRLREKVKQSAMAQLENGVITANDFLKQVNDEAQARQNKTLHQVQTLMAQYNQQTTTGNQP